MLVYSDVHQIIHSLLPHECAQPLCLLLNLASVYAALVNPASQQITSAVLAGTEVERAAGCALLRQSKAL